MNPLSLSTLMTRVDGPPTLRALWKTLSPLPGGKRAFSKVIGALAPYTGTIDGQVRALGHGHAEVAMADRKAVRNHLRSVHAIAMMNLAEMSTGLALVASLPANARGILTGLSIEYLHKGRGTLVGRCTCTPPTEVTERVEMEVPGEIVDASGRVVARATARWLVGPA